MMPQLAEMRNQDDDWTGITRTAERKKRQNRLNQRAYRRRRGAHQKQILTSTVRIANNNHNDQGNQQQQQAIAGEHNQVTNKEAELNQGYLVVTSLEKRTQILAFIQKVYEEYSLNAPRLNCLPQLIRLNVLNAMSRNASALSIPVEGLCQDDFISPFNKQGPRPIDEVALLSSCPESLRPTALQVVIQHHPWIDLFPIPRMRENILNGIVAGVFEEDELCDDLLNMEDDDQEEKASLIVWGESWDFHNWEASVPFMRKWGWLIQGCPEIVEATNYWRERRGEKKLIYNL